MKKVTAGVVAVLISVGVIFLTAFASDNKNSGLGAELEEAIQNSPEVSSMLDSAASGNLVNADALKDALGQIDGLDLDQLLNGLEGLDENDGLLGKLSSLLGPNSDGLAGIISNIGGNVGSSGAASSGSGIISGILDRFLGNGNSNSSAAEAPTVHTTAGSYNQNVQTPSVYTPSYNFGSSGSNVIDYSQYTGTYTLPATVIAEITTQAYVTPNTTVPANQVAVAIPVGAEQQTEQKNTNWKKIVGAILVFGSFATIAAVIIKKSM